MEFCFIEAIVMDVGNWYEIQKCVSSARSRFFGNVDGGTSF